MVALYRSSCLPSYSHENGLLSLASRKTHFQTIIFTNENHSKKLKIIPILSQTLLEYISCTIFSPVQEKYWCEKSARVSLSVESMADSKLSYSRGLAGTEGSVSAGVQFDQSRHFLVSFGERFLMWYRHSTLPGSWYMKEHSLNIVKYTINVSKRF